MKIQLDLAEKELSTLISNMKLLDEENKCLRKDNYVLESKLKEQDKLLKAIPEPSSPSVFYEEKMKEMTKKSNELKAKLLDKDSELEHLYAHVQALEDRKYGKRDLRKSRSLDSEMEVRFNVVVDLKRQLEISNAEIETLKKKLTKNDKVEKEGFENNISCDDMTSKDRNSNSPDLLSGLALTHVEPEEETKLKTKINMLEVSKKLLEKNIENLLHSIISYSESHIPEIYRKHISKIANISISPTLIESHGARPADDSAFVNAELPREPGNSCKPGVLKTSEFPGSRIHTASDVADDKSNQTNGLSRDPDTVLFIIEQAFCKLAKLLCEMDREKREEVVPDGNKVLPEVGLVSDSNSNRDSQVWDTSSESSDNTEDYHSAKSELSTPTNDGITPTNQNMDLDGNFDLTSPRNSQFIEQSLAFIENSNENRSTMKTDSENNPCESEDGVSVEELRKCETVTSESVISDVKKEPASETCSLSLLQTKITFLEEEVGKWLFFVSQTTRRVT